MENLSPLAMREASLHWSLSISLCLLAACLPVCLSTSTSCFTTTWVDWAEKLTLFRLISTAYLASVMLRMLIFSSRRILGLPISAGQCAAKLNDEMHLAPHGQRGAHGFPKTWSPPAWTLHFRFCAAMFFKKHASSPCLSNKERFPESFSAKTRRKNMANTQHRHHSRHHAILTPRSGL